MPPDATSKEIPVTNSQTIETDIQCECGEWSGERCAWSGPRSETTAVEYMPVQHRSSHAAAGNVGAYVGAAGETLAQTATSEICNPKETP